MKCAIVLCLLLLSSLALAQVADRFRESMGDRARENLREPVRDELRGNLRENIRARGKEGLEALTNFRAGVMGKLGESSDNLDTSFRGYLTHVTTPDNYEITHCQSRVVPSDATLKDRQPQSSGKILDDYCFYDKESGSLNIFFVVRDDENDLGTCWALLGNQANAQISDWEASKQKCGPNEEGTVVTRSFSYTDANQKAIEGALAACLIDGKVAYISAEHAADNQSLMAMQAKVSKQLPKPDINDRATALELSVPASCFTGDTRPFDVSNILDSITGNEQQDKESLSRRN